MANAVAVKSKGDSSTACPGSSRKSKSTGHFAQNDDEAVGLGCWRGEADNQKFHGGTRILVCGFELTIGFG